MTPRLAMNRIREILRQKWSLDRSHRAIAASVGVGLGSVTKVLARASGAGLTLEIIDALDDDELERRVQGERVGGTRKRTPPDLEAVHREHKRPGVTLELLHLEYLGKHPNGYKYTNSASSTGDG